MLRAKGQKDAELGSEVANLREAEEESKVRQAGVRDLEEELRQVKAEKVGLVTEKVSIFVLLILILILTIYLCS